MTSGYKRESQIFIELLLKRFKYNRCGIYFVKIGRGYNDNETIDNSLKTKLSFGYSLLLS